MVSVCLPSDALLQHLPSYSGFSYLGHGVSLHSCISKAQPLLLILAGGYVLTTALPDLQRGIAPLGPPAPVQPRLMDVGLVLPLPPLASGVGLLLLAAAPGLGHGLTPLGRFCAIAVWYSAIAPDLGGGLIPLVHCPSCMGSSRLLPLTSDMGWLLLAALSAPVAAACA